MGMFDALFKKKPLKPTEVSDRSAPVVEKDVKVKKSSMPDVKKEIESNAPALKPAEVNDRSAPVVEKDVTIKPSPRLSLQNEIKDKAAEYRQAEAARDVVGEISKGTAVELKKVDETQDRSAPIIEKDVQLKTNPMAELKKELTASSPELKHVDETADRSAPIVETGIKLKESPMAALQKEIAEKKDEITGFATTGAQRVAAKDVIGEISKGASGLKHVDETQDRSAPMIEKEVQLKTNPMAELKKELTAASPELKPVEASDRSAPKIEADVRVNPSPMAALQKEIVEKKDEIETFAATGGVKVAKEGVLDEIAKGASGLKHVDETQDRSAPMIEKEVQLKTNPMAELKKELTASSPELKHVDETADRSAPMIEKEVTLKPSPMAALQKEIVEKKDEIETFAATGGVKVVKEGVLDEIAKGASGLKHVDETQDRSAPMIEKEVQLKTNPMAELKKELTAASPELKPVEASDRSAPMIEKEVTLKPSPMPALLDDIKRRASQEAVELS